MCLMKFLTERKVFLFGEFFEGANMLQNLDKKLFFGWRILLEIYTFIKYIISDEHVKPISTFIHVPNNTNICLVGASNKR